MNGIIFSIAMFFNIGIQANLCKTFCMQDAKYIEHRIGQRMIATANNDELHLVLDNREAIKFFNRLSKNKTLVSFQVHKIKKSKYGIPITEPGLGKYTHYIDLETWHGDKIVPVRVFVKTYKGNIIKLNG